MTDRRAFLRSLGFGTVSAAAAALTFDVEKLLWVAGEKTIVIPSPGTLVHGLFKGDIVTFEGVFDINRLTGRDVELLKAFVITEDVISAPVTDLPVYPQMLADGHYRNVSRLPARNAKLIPLCGVEFTPE